MANLLDIRRRIRSVRNIRQITKAMKMVSAAKLRRAQEQALAARPYAEQLRALLAELAARVDAADLEGLGAQLLAGREERRLLLVTISADKGLAGAFNANVFKAAQGFIAEHGGADVELELVGRKARDYFRRRPARIAGEHLGLFGRGVNFEAARAIAARLIARFAANEVDAVYSVGNEFKSVLQQRVTLRRILPVEAPALGAGASGAFIFEPAPGELLAKLLPRYVESQLHRALLESFAAEHAARMNAMDTATRNAGEMIDGLTLTMNRVRQAAITKEIIEIVSGAAAQEDA